MGTPKCKKKGGNFSSPLKNYKNSELKKYQSGHDKLWLDGRYVLRLHRRGVRLFDLFLELQVLKLPTCFVAYDLFLVYRCLTLGIRSGRYKFAEAEEMLLRIEDFFNLECKLSGGRPVSLSTVFRQLGEYGVEVSDVFREFAIEVGFISCGAADEVTRRVLRKLGSG